MERCARCGELRELVWMPALGDLWTAVFCDPCARAYYLARNKGARIAVEMAEQAGFIVRGENFTK